jgi:uncharacterized protein (DUF983 family)
VAGKSIWLGVRRGLSLHCPNCGTGRLFAGFLKLRTPCAVCAADNTVYPSDDFPPYLTILVAGHAVIPAFMYVDFTFAPAMWVEAAIWLPLTTILCLALLPVMKGAAIGLCWAADMVRPDSVRSAAADPLNVTPVKSATAVTRKAFVPAAPSR